MQAESTTINPYLQQEVLTASPIRLRWLLVNRAEELTGVIGQMWQTGEFGQAAQWIIRLRDILGELLEGVQDHSNPVSKDVADFYVFLLQMLVDIEQTQSIPRLSTLRELLKYEADTWQMVLERNAREMTPSHGDSYGFQSPLAPTHSSESAFGGMSAAGGFSLEV